MPLEEAGVPINDIMAVDITKPLGKLESGQKLHGYTVQAVCETLLPMK